ncbi:MAG: mechanosensitive ion channel [Planctomycetota bacterium]
MNAFHSPSLSDPDFRLLRWALLIALVLSSGAALAQEGQEPESQEEPPPLGRVAPGLSTDLPGGLDMEQEEKVRARLQAVQQELQGLPEDEPRRADRVKLLQTQVDILEDQLALIQARIAIDALDAQITDQARETARNKRDQERESLAQLDLARELEALDEIETLEALRERVEQGFVAAAKEKADAFARLGDRVSQHKSDIAAIDASRAAAQGSLTTHQSRLDELRRELQNRSDLEEDERKLIERRIAIREQGIFYERGRLDFLDRQAEVLGRNLELLNLQLEGLQATVSRLRQLEEGAKERLERRLTESAKALENEAEQKQKEIDAASETHERLIKTQEVQALQLEAKSRTLEQEKATVETRREDLDARLESAQRRLGELRDIYGGEPGAATRPELDDVQSSLRLLREQTDRGSFRVRLDEVREKLTEYRRELESLEKQLLELDAKLEQAQFTARASYVQTQRMGGLSESDAETAWRQSERSRWTDVRAKQREFLESSIASLQSIVTDLQATRDAMTKLQEVRRTSLVLLQRENLFLRGETRISWESISEGVRDLWSLPEQAVLATRDLVRYFSAVENRSGLVGCLIAILFSGLVLGSFARGFRKRSIRMIERGPAALPARSAILAVRLLQASCIALFLLTAPLWARWLLNDLSYSMQEWLASLGRVLATFWIARVAVRELLRPKPAERAVIQLGEKSATWLYLSSMWLLYFSVFFLPIQQSLIYFGYGNRGALELLDLIYKGVTGLTLFALALSREVVTGLVPASSSRVARLLGWLIRTLRPILLLLIPALLIIECLRYEFLAALVWRVSGLIVIVALGGYLAYLGGCYVVEGWLGRVLGLGEQDDIAARRRSAARSISLFLLKLAVVFGGGWIFLFAAGFELSDFRLLLTIPLPFQASEAASPVTWWDVIVAATALFVFLPAARHGKLALTEFLAARTNLDAGLRYTITTMVGYFFVGLGIYLALIQLVNLESLGYVVAALSVGIGFGLQEIVSNFVSGIILLFERPLRVGDIIEVGGQEGIVRRIDIRATTLQTRDNLWLLVPNKDLVTKEVINFVYTDAKLRIRITVGVAYGSDTALVRKVLLEVADNDGRVLERPAPDVYFVDFGSSSLDFVLLVWVSDSLPKERIASDLRFAIDAAFRRHGIRIPFPQRDLHIVSADAKLRVLTEDVSTEPDDDDGDDEPEPEKPQRRIP